MAVDAGPGQFVAKLEEWRGQLGLSHGDFAAKIGISQSQWSMLRHGKRRVSRELAGRVMVERPEFQVFWIRDVLAEQAA